MTDNRATARLQPATDRGAGRIARNRMRIAWMYYVEGLTQTEIADRLGVGRITVVRNLNEALRNGDVRISLEGPVGECVRLEEDLKAAFGFLDAVVVPEPSDPAAVAQAVGVAVGDYVSENLTDNLAVGVGWGRTLHQSLPTLVAGDHAGINVVSLLGGIVQARRFNPSEFAWQFANRVGADCYLLAAPAVVDSAETRRALVERCGLDAVLKRSESLDMAVVSVGTPDPSSTTFRVDFLSEQDRLDLVARGAVGDVLFHFFDAEGQLVDHPINGRIVSVTMEQLAAIPRRVIASGGLDKLRALRGAIKLINCNVLITSEATARALLEEPSP
jgi:DNA-binding transcriptional regulator LsrR (DeoR family)